MATGCLFDRAPLSCHGLLLRVTFSACSRLDRVRGVPDLWPLRTDFSFFGFGVRIHKVSAPCLRLGELEVRRAEGEPKTTRPPGSIFRKASPLPCYQETTQCRISIEETKRCAAFFRGNDAGQHCLKQRSLRAHSYPPENHPG